MSFAAFRASLRKTPFSPARAARVVRTPSGAFRRYSTEVPKKSNTALFAGLGAAAIGGIAIYVYVSDSNSAKEAGTAVKSGVQVAKSAAHFTPTKDDYQKVHASLARSRRAHADRRAVQVYNKIADIMEEAADKNYDGACERPAIEFVRSLRHSIRQMARMVPCSFA